jgi:hypothetical protein
VDASLRRQSAAADPFPMTDGTKNGAALAAAFTVILTSLAAAVGLLMFVLPAIAPV